MLNVACEIMRVRRRKENLIGVSDGNGYDQNTLHEKFKNNYT